MAAQAIVAQRYAPYAGAVIASDPSVVFDGQVYRMSHTELDPNGYCDRHLP